MRLRGSIEGAVLAEGRTVLRDRSRGWDPAKGTTGRHRLRRAEVGGTKSVPAAVAMILAQRTSDYEHH